MTEAEYAQIARIVQGVLLQTLHPSVLRPRLVPAPEPANDFHQPDPPLDAA